MAASTFPRARRAALALAPLAALGLTAAALALPAPRERWEEGWHIVRPGDTLEDLAQSYLGSHQLWPELHALNPQIKDPHRIYPGQRLRVYHAPPTEVPTAQVEALSRRVEERPQPVPWRAATEGDLLLARDSVRTYANASARLRFDDGSSVTLTEESLVFLRAQTPATAPSPRKEIEVLVGQADVAAGGAAGRRVEVEILVGEARARGAADTDLRLEARSRRTAEEGAQFMTFAGSTTVAAAGAEVELPAGTGTQVAARAAPGPVERLLPAPELRSPGAGEEIERAAPALAWSAVEGAARYVVEACLDPECGAVHERAEVVSPAHRLADATPEHLFWRVTAVAASGLDGFPSAPREVRLVDVVAPGAPVLALMVEGVEVAPGACVRTPPTARVSAPVAGGAAQPWTLELDGRPATQADIDALAGGIGRHRLAARVTDPRGRTASSAPADFDLDGAGPWLALTGTTGPPAEHGQRRKRVRLAAEPQASSCAELAVEVEAAAGTFAAVPCGAGAAPLGVAARGGESAWQLRVKSGPARVGEQVDARPGEPLRLAAGDLGCGLEAVELRVVPSPHGRGRLLLEAEARDLAGNRHRLGWHLDPR